MTLKKTDKIIAVIGVLIIVISGIGIFYYAVNQEESENGGITTPVSENKTYNITFIEEMTTLPKEEYQFGNMLGGKGLSLVIAMITGKSVSIEQICAIPQDNLKSLKSIEFNITYRDTTVGLLGMAKDTLKVTITDPDEKQITSTIKGSGNAGLLIDNINSMIDMAPIEAKTHDEAMTQLETRYLEKTNWKDLPFKMSANLKISLIDVLNPLLRIGERLKADKFSVEITYTYYVYDLQDPDIPNDDNTEDTTDDDITGTSLSTIIQSGGLTRW